MNLVVLSGGLDSTVALAVAVGRGPARAVSFDYGQRHHRELIHAAAVADHYGIAHKVITVGLHGGLVDNPIPDGRYDEESMRATVVPGRNLVFAALAVADAEPSDTVVFGVHAGDHPIYPDCRPGFWASVGVAARAYDVNVFTPLIGMTKAEVVTVGADLHAPLALTWSCYKGGLGSHCGRCGTCVERAEAFHLAGVPDPTTYDDPAYWRSKV